MQILKIRKQNFEKVLKKAAKFISRGKVLVCPTDTVYGLLADSANKKAMERIFKIKKRQKTKPVPIFVKDLKMAKELAKIDRRQEKFLMSVWPGKVTVILKKKKAGTIGLRIPNYKFINQLLLKTDRPLTGTSANISGSPSSIKIKEIIKQFIGQKERPDIVIDAGNLTYSKPSKVIDLTGLKPRILRR